MSVKPTNIPKCHLRKSADSAGNISRHCKLGELTENIRTFALPFESRTYTFKMQYEYDSWNRIQEMTYPDGEVVHYDYNRGGMLKKVYEPPPQRAEPHGRRWRFRSPVNAASATRSVERDLQRTPVCLRGRRRLHRAPDCYKKILLLHRRTSVYEPRPNISPRPPRPRTLSAGRRRLHAPAAPLLTTHC